MQRLTVDQKELLAELVMSETWPAVIAMANQVVDQMVTQLVGIDVGQKDGHRMLLIQKARVDGAKALVNVMANIKQELKQEKGNGGRKRMVQAR